MGDDMDGDSDNNEGTGFLESNSVTNVMLLLMSLCGIALAMFGICVGVTKSLVGTVFFFIGSCFYIYYTGAITLSYTALSTMSEEHVDLYCESENFEELVQRPGDNASMGEMLAYNFQESFYKKSKGWVESIDRTLTGEGLVDRYMCKKECKCDYRGLTQFGVWAGD